MNRLGFNAGDIDGILGPITDGAIKRMQKFLGTDQDGLVGPLTRNLINSSCDGTTGEADGDDRAIIKNSVRESDTLIAQEKLVKIVSQIQKQIDVLLQKQKELEGIIKNLL
ncbi:MAG: peptidoglycan-binding protein [Candidatus Pacebacteria bacterium]|nr:peptidoglycan-binding protein [Candidatus Paceibacterota bacterium]